jgi:hypothetical protein
LPISSSCQLEVVLPELLLHLLAGEPLDRAPVPEQLDERARLADVLEVGGDHRVERLLAESLDVADTLDHEGALRWSMWTTIGVLRDQGDLGQDEEHRDGGERVDNPVRQKGVDDPLGSPLVDDRWATTSQNGNPRLALRPGRQALGGVIDVREHLAVLLLAPCRQAAGGLSRRIVHQRTGLVPLPSGPRGVGRLRRDSQLPSLAP